MAKSGKHNLTKAQQTKARKLYKTTKDQKRVAKGLGVAKWRVNLFFREKKIGKRRKSAFWDDVKSIQRLHNISWKAATHKTKHIPYWTEKRAARAHKEIKDFSDFWEEMREKYGSGHQKEKEEELAEQMEEMEFQS